MSRLLLLTKFPVTFSLNKIVKRYWSTQFQIPISLNRNFSAPAPVRIRKLSARETGKAMKFVRDKFTCSEPLMKGLNMDQCSLSVPLVEFIRNEIDQGMTYIATSTHKLDFKRCYGMVVNTRLVPWDPDLWNFFSDCIKCVKTKNLLTLWSFLVKDSDMFQKFKTPKIFNIAHVLINEDANKEFQSSLNAQGMSSVLIEKSLKLAEHQGYPLVSMLCTGRDLSKFAQDCGMKLFYDFPYSQLLNENLKPIVNTIEPNSNVKIYVKEFKRK